MEMNAIGLELYGDFVRKFPEMDIDIFISFSEARLRNLNRGESLANISCESKKLLAQDFSRANEETLVDWYLCSTEEDEGYRSYMRKLNDAMYAHL